MVVALSKIPANKDGQGLLNPVALAKEKYLSSQRGSTELIRAVMGGDHSPTPATSWQAGKKCVTGRKTRMMQTKPKSRV